jgi:hypothetical protein
MNSTIETKVFEYLKVHGPTPRTVFYKELRLNNSHITKLLRASRVIKSVYFRMGHCRRGSRKYTLHEIYGELSKLGSILFIRDDPRIVDYMAERIPFKIKSHHDARTLYLYLKKHFDSQTVRKIIEKLGYRYRRTYVEQEA